MNAIFTELWSQPDPAKVGQFYHQDLVGYFGNERVTFADIQNRASFCQRTFSGIQNEIQDVIAEDNKIVVRLKQTSMGKDAKDTITLQLIGIYYLRDNKVSQVWFLTDKLLDYKQTA